MSLPSMLRSGATIHQIAAHLDGLDPETRLAEVRAVGRRDQELLYQRAADAPPITLERFVGKEVAPLREVIHHGKNSQPAFRDFEKRFCRPEDGSEQLFGFNEGPARRLIGPGYFVARVTEGGGSDPRGAVVVDYFTVPDGPVVPSWPEVRPNSSGLQRFVFHRTRDYMRRVSSHVSIGKAIKDEQRAMGYFVLCRQDPAR
jgi:hypothetical protein